MYSRFQKTMMVLYSVNCSLHHWYQLAMARVCWSLAWLQCYAWPLASICSSCCCLFFHFKPSWTHSRDGGAKGSDIILVMCQSLRNVLFCTAVSLLCKKLSCTHFLLQNGKKEKETRTHSGAGYRYVYWKYTAKTSIASEVSQCFSLVKCYNMLCNNKTGRINKTNSNVQ